MSNKHIYFMRQMDLLDPTSMPEVCLIGYGGVGSVVSLFLTKMGVRRWTIYEPDDIQHHNLSNQMFPNDSIGKLKVDLAIEELSRMAPMRDDIEVEAKRERFVEGSNLNGADIVISALDNMESRRAVWAEVKAQFPSLYIDARMGGEVAKVYALSPLDGGAVRYYEKSLVQSDYNVPCTASAISYNLGLIAAMVGSNVRRFLSNLPVPRLLIGDSLNMMIIKQ